MSSEPPHTIVPDKYLNITRLEALFNEFNVAMKASHPPEAIFSSLVNNVRQVYTAALLGVNDELLDQFKHNARQMAREYKQERVPPPKHGANMPERAATSTLCGIRTPALAKLAENIAGELGGRETNQTSPLDLGKVGISWPANTFTLHIGSYSVDHRRDMPDWKPMNRDGWTERLDFKVFKYQEPGTVMINVLEQHSSHRMMATLERLNSDGGWKKRLEFYAYDRERPGTQMVWVAYRADPDRCIFLKGNRTDKLEGWERKFEFWVPV